MSKATKDPAGRTARTCKAPCPAEQNEDTLRAKLRALFLRTPEGREIARAIIGGLTPSDVLAEPFEIAWRPAALGDGEWAIVNGWPISARSAPGAGFHYNPPPCSGFDDGYADTLEEAKAKAEEIARSLPAGVRDGSRLWVPSVEPGVDPHWYRESSGRLLEVWRDPSDDTFANRATWKVEIDDEPVACIHNPDADAGFREAKRYAIERAGGAR